MDRNSIVPNEQKYLTVLVDFSSFLCLCAFHCCENLMTVWFSFSSMTFIHCKGCSLWSVKLMAYPYNKWKCKTICLILLAYVLSDEISILSTQWYLPSHISHALSYVIQQNHKRCSEHLFFSPVGEDTEAQGWRASSSVISRSLVKAKEGMSGNLNSVCLPLSHIYLAVNQTPC